MLRSWPKSEACFHAYLSSLLVYNYVYTSVCVCMYICVYIYTHIYISQFFESFNFSSFFFFFLWVIYITISLCAFHWLNWVKTACFQNLWWWFYGVWAFMVVLDVKAPKIYVCHYGYSQKCCFMILLISMLSKLHLVYWPCFYCL